MRKHNPTRAANENTSYWHRAACRVYLHLELTAPALRVDDRLEEAAKILRGLRVIVPISMKTGRILRYEQKKIKAKGGRAITASLLKTVIKRKREDGTLDALRQIYAEPGGLIEFNITNDFNDARERDGDGSIATAAEKIALHTGSRTADQRKRAYEALVQRGARRVRAVIQECDLEWSILQAELKLAGVDVGDFPASELIRRATEGLA